MWTVLLIEVDESTPRQRTILRRELLRQNWRLTPQFNMLFSKTHASGTTEDQAWEALMEQLNLALQVAAIDAWKADCVFYYCSPQNPTAVEN